MNTINKYDIKIRSQDFVNEENEIVIDINKAYITSFKNDLFEGSK